MKLDVRPTDLDTLFYFEPMSIQEPVRALAWRSPYIFIAILTTAGWRSYEQLPRNGLEYWAARESTLPGLKWCGLTASEILVRLDEWLARMDP